LNIAGGNEVLTYIVANTKIMLDAFAIVTAAKEKFCTDQGFAEVRPNRKG
jgi:hypothetical protein